MFMKNLVRRPLKIVAAAMFIAAIGYGLCSTLSTLKNTQDISLLTLQKATAQGESSCHYRDMKNRWLARGCKFAPGWLCELC